MRDMSWFAGSLFLVTVVAFSHAQTVDLKVRIPFKFVAENMTLRAWEYVVTRLGGGKEVMRLSRNDGMGLVTLIPASRKAGVHQDR
jgi:hypothetical protein